MKERDFIRAATIVAAMYQEADKKEDYRDARIQREKALVIESSFIMFFVFDNPTFDAIRFKENIQDLRRKNEIRMR